MSFLSLDSPVMRTLGKVADLMLLNILFVICCIPIITIGDSITAMCYVVLRIREGKDGYITRSFFHSFKQNFRQSTIIWLMNLVVVFLMLADWAIIRSGTGMMTTVMTVLVVFVLIIYLLVVLLVFSVQARFDNTIKNTIKNSMIMAIADLPRVFVTLLIIVAAILVSLLTYTLFYWSILFWTILGFASVAYWNSSFIDKILEKYMPKEDEKNPDDWDVDETMGPDPEGKLTEEESAENAAKEQVTAAEEAPAIEDAAAKETAAQETASGEAAPSK